MHYITALYKRKGEFSKKHDKNAKFFHLFYLLASIGQLSATHALSAKIFLSRQKKRTAKAAR
jgi:hypothetical protein